MNILKKRGRPRKDEEIAKEKEEKEARQRSEKMEVLKRLRQQLKGKTILYLRDKLQITFKIEKVMALYDGFCLTDGKADGYSLTLVQEELESLMKFGCFSKKTTDGERETCENFTLVGEDGQLSTDLPDIPSVDPSEVEVAQPPFIQTTEGTGEPSQKEDMEKYLGELCDKCEEIVEEEENEEEEDLRGVHIVQLCSGEINRSFLRMTNALDEIGTSPSLILLADSRRQLLVDTLHEMAKWHHRKEKKEGAE